MEERKEAKESKGERHGDKKKGRERKKEKEREKGEKKGWKKRGQRKEREVKKEKGKGKRKREREKEERKERKKTRSELGDKEEKGEQRGRKAHLLYEDRKAWKGERKEKGKKGKRKIEQMNMLYTSYIIILLLFLFKHIVTQRTDVCCSWYSGNLSSQVVGFISREWWIAHNLLITNLLIKIARLQIKLTVRLTIFSVHLSVQQITHISQFLQ